MNDGKDKRDCETCQPPAPTPKTPQQQLDAITVLIKEGLLAGLLLALAVEASQLDQVEPAMAIQFLISAGMTRDEAEEYVQSTRRHSR